MLHIVQRMVLEQPVRPVECQVRLEAERVMFLKRRWRAVAEDGAEFGFDLEDRLKNGCVFFQSPTHDYVIWQKPEMVYEMDLEDASSAALAGWKIGNLHMPVQVIEGVIRIIHDPAVRQLLEREGWPYREAMVVFNPLRVAAHAS